MSSKEDTPLNRKDQILKAAAALFAEKGYYKTTTADVARAVGVTQPYVFHFFKTKEALYLAVLQKAKDIILYVFSHTEASMEQLQVSMGRAFEVLLKSHRNEMLLIMTAFTTPEPAIRDYVRAGFDEVYERVRIEFTKAGIEDPENQAKEFIGCGLLITMAEVLQLPKLFL
ncbi:TetR/AcrR family transcriptional regulator [Sporolactobacillus shoreae]|uniref:TetR/AcrR family transcriptional regulator n=1 Tax=Sporolactobacillus shoreae TaxID=1465501 RepID=A0A4Z0GR26_9BACL|nr:TetR/AcrR family transcriptional regulator [Sporolactobacillus shoreae]TGA98896.1 TetR/AcrR family transcriptional regulator [Sporolactobacillus shoreae]